MMMMMIKDKRDIRPLLVKFGVALALSFAGFLYSRIRTKRIKPSDTPRSPPPSISDSDEKVEYGGRLRVNNDDPQPDMDSVDAYDKPCIRVRVDSSSRHASPIGRYSSDKEGFLLPEFDQVVKEFNVVTSPKTEAETFTINTELPKKLRSIQRDDYELEIENLKKRIKFLVEREKRLEVQLLEYYGLKEQEKAMMELQNRLKLNNMEAKIFLMKIETLQAENNRLEARVADYSKVVSELEAAKAKIKMLKRKIRYEAEQNKEQILDLTERVARLQDQEYEASTSNSDVHSELKRLNELEVEVEELRKSNENLQRENADLAQRLESTQILANCLFEDPEKEELSKAMLHLREEHENLTKEVERLQADRCADVEELVYLRWINACLRYELRNFQPAPGKMVARDLSKCLSPRSEQKAKQLILEYANTEEGAEKGPNVDFDFEQWPSSQPSYLTDSTDHDDSPGCHKPHSKKLKFFANLRKLIRGKYSPHHHQTHNNENTRASMIYRSLSVDDIGRRYDEPGTEDPRSNPRSPNLASSSQNSNNSSLEYQPLSSLVEEDENGSRTSDPRSSQGGVRFVLGKENDEGISPLDYRSEHESEDSQKSELAKYAEVLRDSRWSQRIHKKSASFSAG